MADAPFGFVEHVRIGDHRAQLGFGDGALVVPRREDLHVERFLEEVDRIDRFEL